MPVLRVALFVLLQAPLASTPPAPSVLYRDVTREAGITFEHHAAPEKKYIVESMSGGVALLRLRPRRAPGHLLRRLAHRRHREQSEGGAQRALSQPRRLQVRGRHRQGGRRPSRLGHGRLHRGRRRRRLGRPLRHRRSAATSFYRNNRDGTFTRHHGRRRRRRRRAGRPAAASPTTTATAISTCSSAATSRSTSRTCPEFGKDKTCEYRGIPVQCGPRGPAGGVGLPVPQRGRRRASPRSARRRACADPRGVLRPRHRVVRRQRRRLARPLRGQRLRTRTSST